MQKTMIPLKDKKGKIIRDQKGNIKKVFRFKNNLDLHAPRYVNEGGSVGLIRAKDGRLVYMFHSEEHSSSDFAEYISEEEGYELCCRRGKEYLRRQLNITPKYYEEGGEV